MNTDEPQQAIDRLSGGVSDAAQRASQLAHEAANTVRVKTDEGITRSQEYVRQNPLPTILGALAVGIAVGYLVTRREEETVAERYVSEPIHSAREAIFAVLAPIASKLHHQYDVARSTAGDAVDRLHSRKTKRAAENWLDDARRFGSNLKFW